MQNLIFFNNLSQFHFFNGHMLWFCLIISWRWAAVDKWHLVFCPSSSDVVPPALLSQRCPVSVELACLLKHVPFTRFSFQELIYDRLPCSSQPHRSAFLSSPEWIYLSFYIFCKKFIFLWFLTSGRSGLKKCADWLFNVNHQWLHHPVSGGSALIIALNWSLNIDL